MSLLHTSLVNLEGVIHIASEFLHGTTGSEDLTLQATIKMQSILPHKHTCSCLGSFEMFRLRACRGTKAFRKDADSTSVREWRYKPINSWSCCLQDDAELDLDWLDAFLGVNVEVTPLQTQGQAVRFM